MPASSRQYWGETVNIDSVRQDLATATKILAQHDLIAPFGHPSARLPGTNAICILADSEAKRKNKLAETSPSDTVIIDLNGDVIEGDHTPPGERFIHTGIYRARPDIQAVVHAHPFMCVALTAAGQSVLPVWNQGTVFAGGVPVFVEPAQIENPELGEKVARVLGEHRALLLRGHGSVNVGGSIQEACVDAVKLEWTAKMQIVAAGLGPLMPIRTDELTDELFTHGVTAAGHYAGFWEYFSSHLSD